jgi:hypothetical protein
VLVYRDAWSRAPVLLETTNVQQWR